MIPTIPDEGDERPGQGDEELDDVLRGEDLKIVRFPVGDPVPRPEEGLELLDAAIEVLLVLEPDPDERHVFRLVLELLHDGRERHDHPVVDVSASLRSAPLQKHPHDLNGDLADLDEFPHGVLLAEEFAHRLVADQGDIRRPPEVLLGEIGPLHHGPAPGAAVVARRADDRGL